MTDYFCRQMRRRHGIPDNDHRPFNVAYAAANKARLQREAGERSRSRVGSVAPQPALVVPPRPALMQGQAAIRQRHGVPGTPASNIRFHRLLNSVHADQYSEKAPPCDVVPGGLQSDSASQRRAADTTDTTERHLYVLDPVHVIN